MNKVKEKQQEIRSYVEIIINRQLTKEEKKNIDTLTGTLKNIAMDSVNETVKQQRYHLDKFNKKHREEIEKKA